MKYICLAFFYFVIWIILGVYLIIERVVKWWSVMLMIIWYLDFKMEWQDRYKTIFFIIPLPVYPVIGCSAGLPPFWYINNFHDYFMMHNWDLFGVKHSGA